MALIKCKMCGGDLVIAEGQSVAECEYCGSKQTVPVADNEKKLTLFARANRLRVACEFDKAAGIYETIVAEFPQEAESYWGLVLCKYGIEYVDDPGTGKKIPTCHRSSFDSVMDDSNLEQALENADTVARRVYREEAKRIEELRKGIVAVSSNEEPYDIFICYKETDENGGRTLDSVLAQDIYDALTDKGYRVFFSRITLEDKLGLPYEPYIFAALHSAKIMLAIGTDYEYYNAVWVKNEWSRYLKLMTVDKSKHLIPCYKGIDAYDMPKEFARLQAQDLGKIGAMQDLLRGIEKIIPKTKPVQTMVQERVVVGGTAGNKIASLLDRGNMALEDGDWAKADSFFEDVLNNDSKNAQAYLGKTLAMEKCRTIDAFARKRKAASEIVKAQKLTLSPDDAHVAQAVEKFCVPGYVTAEQIRGFYDFDLSYHSDVAGRVQQYRNEEAYWANHKLLSRAEKFAVGAVAENLKREKGALFTALSERAKQAEAAEAAAIKDVRERYAAHLHQADAEAVKLYKKGIARQEADYQSLLQTAKNSCNVEELTETAHKFDALNGYQNSRKLAEHCRKRAAEEQAKLDAEVERKRIQKDKQEKARKAKNKRIAILASIVSVLVIAVVVVVTKVIIPGNNYKKAGALLAEGKYEEAIAVYEALGDYNDSLEKAKEAHFTYISSEVEAGNYQNAYDIAYSLEQSERRNEVLKEIAKYGRYVLRKQISGDSETQYEYNGLGYPIRAVTSGETTNIHEYTYVFDENGNIVTCTENYQSGDNATDYQFIYEFFSGETGISSSYLTWFEDPSIFGKEISMFDFFHGVQRVSRKYNDGSWSYQTFDQQGLALEHQTNYSKIYETIWEKDEQGRITGWRDFQNMYVFDAYDIEYDDHGYMSQMDDYSIYRTYDEFDRITHRKIDSGDKYWISADYEYDSYGNCVKYTHKGHYDNDNYEFSFEWEWLSYDNVESVIEETKSIQAAKEKALAADYAAAEDLIASGDYLAALRAFEALGTYADAQQQAMQLWSIIANRETISADISTTMAVHDDGTVVYAGNTAYDKDGVTDWTDIVEISQGTKITLGLKSNGTVVGVGEDVFSSDYLSGITNAVDIVAADKHYLVLLADGTLEGEGFNDYGQLNVADWTDVIAIDATLNFSVGLRSDGTVLFAGDNEYGQLAVTDWTDIVEIDIGHSCVFGRKSDGTVVATKNTGDYYQWGQENVADWSNIIDIAAGSTHTVGLRADGTVVAVGRNDDGECDVSGWRNIVAVYAADDCTIGLKEDGSVVVTGKDDFGELALTGWTNIKLPN